MGDLQNEALATACAAARKLGFSVQRAEVMRIGTSVLVHLPRADVVARIEPRAHEASVRRQVAFASASARVGAPVVKLRVAEPVLEGQAWVTFWEFLEAVGEVTAEGMGAAARLLHDATLGGVASVPPADPLEGARRLLAVPHPHLRPDDQAGLVALIDRMATRWATEVPPDRALVHGDLHRGNVVMTACGPILVDLEYAGVGPPGLDAAALGAHVHRYGLNPQWIEGFAAGYGAPVQSQPAFELLCDVYALHVALWAVQVAGTGVDVAREADLRVQCLLGRSQARWTLR